MPRSARLALSAGYVFLGLVFLLCAAWGIGVAVDASRPVQWGTFTQSSCESTKSGCRPIGSWTSDDGSRTLDGVVLAGSTGPVETARAGYRDGAAASNVWRMGTSHLFDTLTPGNNTFTMRYLVGSGVGTFGNRELIVLPF